MPAGPLAASRQLRPGQPGGAGQPSWAAVLATTVRLWAQRRLRRIRRLWATQARLRVAATVLLLVVVFLAGAAAAALFRGGSPGG